MGILMIKCPTTGRDIPTGIETDWASFTSAPVFFSRTYLSDLSNQPRMVRKAGMASRDKTGSKKILVG